MPGNMFCARRLTGLYCLLFLMSAGSLLEDPKKGVVLQGVEERPVNSAKDIFAILQGTNKQRRTAETL